MTQFYDFYLVPAKVGSNIIDRIAASRKER